MGAPSSREPLAKVDSAWLRMDEATNPMVVTLLLIFEQPIEYDWIRRLIETRLLEIPRFRQRVVLPHFGTPCWEADPHFDINQHLEQVELEDRTDEASLGRVVSAAMSRSLDPARPLWHFYFVPGYRDGSALVARIHHCIGDGFGLMHVFLSMADRPESVAEAIGPTGPFERPPSRLSVLRHAMAGAIETARLLLMKSDPSSRLKGPLRGEKRATWSNPIPLEHVKAVSRATGASVNDVLLTAVTGALRRYLLMQTPVEDDLKVRSVVPVNLRHRNDAHLLGNRFGLLFVPMPVGLSDPAQRLVEVCRRMRALKQSPEPMVTFQILWALGVAPRRLFDLVVNMFGRKATAVVTNVIGPREAITYGGVRLSQGMFWVPCAGKLGLGISILSYAGRVSVGFAADAGLIPDPETIGKGFDAELAQLLERTEVQESNLVTAAAQALRATDVLRSAFLVRRSFGTTNGRTPTAEPRT